MANRSRRKREGVPRATFKELCGLSRRRANGNLMQRARRASRLAKAVRGKARRQFYAVKHRCLRTLIGVGGVQPDADHTRFPGLLSVGVDGEGRLHTHEAWMEVSSRNGHKPGGSPRRRLAWREVTN